MKTIWKYVLQLEEKQNFDMPIGAEILSCGLDPMGQISIWAMVDTEKDYIGRQIVIVGTGNPVPTGLKFIGSVTQGPFMWHIFTN